MHFVYPSDKKCVKNISVDGQKQAWTWLISNKAGILTEDKYHYQQSFVNNDTLMVGSSSAALSIIACVSSSSTQVSQLPE